MPKINATEEQYLALKGHQDQQYTILNTANNHIIDCGSEGVETTLNRLTSDQIYNVGTQLTPEEANSPLIIVVGGITLGFIGMTYSVNLRPYPNNQRYLVNEIPFHKKPEADLNLIYKQIAVARRKNCDFIILSLHWGIEYEFFPTKRQVKIVHQLAQDGIDLIISHHAHCIQTYELYPVQRNNERIVPIFYGIGNLTALTSANHTLLSLLLNFTLVKGTIQGENMTFVKSLKIHPVFQLEYKEKASEHTFYTIEILSEWLNKSVNNKNLKKRIKEWNEFCELTLGKSWKKNENTQ